MGIIPGPIDGDESTWWQVPQECDGLTEEEEPCSCVQKYTDNPRNQGAHATSKLKGIGSKEGKGESDDAADDGGSDWDSARKDGNSKRSDTPEVLLGVSWERTVPSYTMNATEDGAEDQQEHDGPHIMLRARGIERRNVRGVCRKGSSHQQIIDCNTDVSKDQNGKCNDG